MIPRTIDRLVRYFDHVEVPPPAGSEAIGQLHAELQSVPSELAQFYEHCDGLRVGLHDGVVGHIYDIQTAFEYYSYFRKVEKLQGLFPIRGDECGDNDCLVFRAGPANGAVVFWDHEIYDGPAYLLAGSFFTYLDMWCDYLVHCYLPTGEDDPRYVAPSLDRWPWIGKAELEHPWPFDEAWLTSRDAKAATLLADETVRSWLLRQA